MVTRRGNAVFAPHFDDDDLGVRATKCDRRVLFECMVFKGSRLEGVNIVMMGILKLSASCTGHEIGAKGRSEMWSELVLQSVLCPLL